LDICQPFEQLFNTRGYSVATIDSDAELNAACAALLELQGLGVTRHLLTMISRATSPATSLTDRLALRAVLAGDDERAARIWRAALKPVPPRPEMNDEQFCWYVICQ